MEKFKILSEIIDKRQSIYPSSYTGELIEKEMIDKLLYNANQAPSHRHTEPWRFYVLAGAAKERFSHFMQEAYRMKYTNNGFNEMKHRKIAEKIKATSHILMISMFRDENESVPEWEEIAAVSCAIQNLYLSVSAAGLGGYWSTPGYLIDEAPAFFRLKENERCLGLFYLGVPKKELPLKIHKRPVEDKVRWVEE